MPIKFQQSTGIITMPSGITYSGSYAGHGEGKNNPILQDVRGGKRFDENAKEWYAVEGLTENDFGPLPCGLYDIATPIDTIAHGPYVMRLTPRPETKMYGRDGMLWHGDNKDKPGEGSDGCIASPPAVRHIGWSGNIDHVMEVIP